MKNIYLIVYMLVIIMLVGCGGNKKDTNKTTLNAICETLSQNKTQAVITDTQATKKTPAHESTAVKPSQSEIKEQKQAQTITKPKNLPKLWDFGSENCMPCKTMIGILNPMIQEFTGKVDIRIINVYKEQALANQYKIQVIPTQVFIDTAGQELFRHVGVLLRDSILGKFTEFNFTK